MFVSIHRRTASILSSVTLVSLESTELLMYAVVVYRGSWSNFVSGNTSTLRNWTFRLEKYYPRVNNLISFNVIVANLCLSIEMLLQPACKHMFISWIAHVLLFQPEYLTQLAEVLVATLKAMAGTWFLL